MKISKYCAAKDCKRVNKNHVCTWDYYYVDDLNPIIRIELEKLREAIRWNNSKSAIEITNILLDFFKDRPLNMYKRKK